MLSLISSSIACFAYNLTMAVASLALGADTVKFIDSVIPFKGTISTALGIYGLSKLPGSYFSFYQSVLDAGFVLYATFEMTQVTHLIVKTSRFFKQRIDFDQGIFQVPSLAILLITALAIVGTVYFSWMDPGPESIALWIACLLLLVYTVMTESKYDAIIMNGALVGLYLAVLTSQDLQLIATIETSKEQATDEAGVYEQIGKTVNTVYEYQRLASTFVFDFLFTEST